LLVRFNFITTPEEEQNEIIERAFDRRRISPLLCSILPIVWYDSRFGMDESIVIIEKLSASIQSYLIYSKPLMRDDNWIDEHSKSASAHDFYSGYKH